MSWMTKFSLKNMVAILILTALVVVSGIVATNQIKVETFPDVTFPVMTVQTVYPNASTEEVEESVTKPIEDVLLNMEGYESISSTSRENLSLITIMYPFGEDIDELQSEVQNKINGLTLPDDAEAKVLAVSSSSIPIYQAAISDADLGALQEDVESTIVPYLENLEGVSSVQVTGKTETKVFVEVDEEKASSYGLTLSDIKEAIQQADYKLPFGTLDESGSSIPVELKGSIESFKGIEEIEIPVQTQNGNGQGADTNSQPPSQGQTAPMQNQPTPTQTKVALSEIAEVKQNRERTEISRFNGEDSILLEVIKTQDANTAEVAEAVQSYLEEKTEDKGYELYTIMDQGEEVNKSISALLKEGGFGALFTVLVILLFLRNIRATIIAIISLPLSILGSIALLEQFGYTLNIMTLGGMAVAVGRIVDDSIVVIENIYRWKQLHPEMEQKELIYKATKEVLGPVASSTVATLIVFLPLGFVSGILGEFFRPFSLSVIFSVTISLIVAIVLIPVLGKYFFKNVSHKSKKGKLIGRYEKFLQGALNRKWIVFTLSIVLLVGSFSMVPALGVSFLPSEGSDSFEVEVTLPEDTTLEESSTLAQQIEALLAEEEAIDYSQVSIGFSSQQQMPGVTATTTENVARFFVKLKEGASIDQIMPQYEVEILEAAQKEYPSTTVKAMEIQQEGPPTGNTIDVKLYSDDLDQLSEASTQVANLLEQDDRLKNVKNDLKDTQTKYQLQLTETGEELNVSPYQLMQPIRERLNNINGGTIKIDNEEWDMELSFDETFDSKEDLEQFTVQTVEGPKPLNEVADIEELQVPSSIKHQDGETANTVSATIKGDDTTEVSRMVESDLQSLSLPGDVELEVTGGIEMISEGFADLGLAMGAAVGLVFLVLSITFGGIITPLVILSSLIFIPIGSLAGLLISGQTLSMSAMIGMLMLIGIVVTNAVVLLDRVETNRKEGIGLTESIIEASSTRLRPILMTALATIFALVPLALSNSASGLISKGLAITVIGGLTTSTLLTLVFVPVLYNAIGRYRKFD